MEGSGTTVWVADVSGTSCRAAGSIEINNREERMNDSNRSTYEQELAAMTAVASSLEPLDPITQGRVVDWAKARFVDETPTAYMSEFNNILMALMKEAKARNLSVGEIEKAAAVVADEAMKARRAEA